MTAAIDVDSLVRDQPWLIAFVFFMILVSVVVMVGGLVRGIHAAGTRQPPVVVVALSLAFTTVGGLVALVIRPDVEALAVAVGSGIGGLSAALALAFERHHVDRRLQEDLEKQSSEKFEELRSNLESDLPKDRERHDGPPKEDA